MKKYILLLLLVSGCSTSQQISNISDSAIQFVESAGKIEMTLNRDGSWKTIKSSGTAAVLLNDNNALEQAMNVATLRAKANLVEFLEVDLRSSKSLSTLTSSFVSDSANNAEIATKVSETISSEAKGIIKGVYVIERKISEDKKYAIVTIMADKRIINAIR